jgi:hypothetical protein
MNKLFVRLAASGAIAASLGAPAFAGSASIDTTGPGSTNTVTSTNCNDWNQTTSNWVGLGNWNYQSANSGDVWLNRNTKVDGFGGSGSAYNSNATGNAVSIENRGNGWSGFGNTGSGPGNARIFLTGPDSYNRISSDNHSSFNSTTTNNVGLANFNDQSARSGDVNISGNTVVRGAGGSGDAANFNSTSNAVDISNSPSGMSWSGSGNNAGNASISTTGPDSYNRISRDNSSSTNLTTRNNVGIVNANNQSANTGDVNVSHNTVVSGFGGSGDASNFNHTANDVSLNN